LLSRFLQLPSEAQLESTAEQIRNGAPFTHGGPNFNSDPHYYSGYYPLRAAT